MITETPPVERALGELRDLLGTSRVDLPELVVLGAEEKVRRLRAETEGQRAAREELAALVRRGDPLVDADRADEVKRLRLG